LRDPASAQVGKYMWKVLRERTVGFLSAQSRDVSVQDQKFTNVPSSNAHKSLSKKQV
jgi:hypothetical protein